MSRPVALITGASRAIGIGAAMADPETPTQLFNTAEATLGNVTALVQAGSSCVSLVCGLSARRGRGALWR